MLFLFFKVLVTQCKYRIFCFNVYERVFLPAWVAVVVTFQVGSQRKAHFLAQLYALCHERSIATDASTPVLSNNIQGCGLSKLNIITLYTLFWGSTCKCKVINTFRNHDNNLLVLSLSYWLGQKEMAIVFFFVFFFIYVFNFDMAVSSN